MSLLKQNTKKKRRVIKLEQKFLPSDHKKHKIEVICHSKVFANKIVNKLLSLYYLIF